MAFINIPNVSIKGLSACVPKTSLENKDYQGFSREEVNDIISAIGVERHRVAGRDVCTSDLLYHSAERLIKDLNWAKSEIDCIIVVTQTPDYILPATSCLLQNRLGLKEDIYALDITAGCSGWIYGLQVLSSLLSHGDMRKGLLMAGDTTLKFCSPEDKSTFPLFGDAGTVTALEFDRTSEGFRFHTASDGGGYDAIIIPDGGFRNQVSLSSFKMDDIKPGIRRNKLQVILDGMNVLSFSITKAPDSVKQLIDHFNLDLNLVDYFLFHQANLFINERIRKKLNLPAEKVPYSLRDYGNTSLGSIPFTMVSELGNNLNANEKKSIIACGFGVGFSWGSVQFFAEKVICSEMLEI